MTLEESKIEIQDIIDIYEKEDMYPLLKDRQMSALKVAISALQAQDSPKPKAESVQNVQNEDLISRKAAIDLWEKYHPTIAVDAMQYDAELRQLPSAQPERCEDCVNFSKTRLLIPQPEKRTEERTETHACDCISRQAAIDYCYHLINVEHQQGSDEMNYGQERVNQTETILHHLEFMPPAQPPHSGRRVYQAGYQAGYEAARKENV